MNEGREETVMRVDDEEGGGCRRRRKGRAAYGSN